MTEAERLIQKLNRAIDDVGAVLADLEDVKDGEIELPEVNHAYAEEAARLILDVATVLNEA